ncbi:MAG: efflux RND transporter permease subunit [Bacteroidia bacterium]|nr:efflux RND transporter permease subunit [Bacteroidia bacterium]
MLKPFKEFFVSSWAVNNKISVYIITIIITVVGLMSYNALPKESFPDIVVPTIYVNTVYAGNSPENIEKFVTDPMETELKSISGVKKMTSSSLQDVSVIIVEFNTDVNADKARKLVEDKVNLAKSKFTFVPTLGPTINEINFSDLPIMYVNVAGNYDLVKLKEYSDKIKDRLRSLEQITRVDVIGAPEREIQVNLDMFAMQARQLSFFDVMGAIQGSNVNASLGTVTQNNVQPSISIKNEFKSIEDLERLVITTPVGGKVFLDDIADVIDGTKDRQSFASLEQKPVITLNVVKKSGQNLIEASDNVYRIIEEMKEKELPKDLAITITGDQSENTRVTIHDLINTIIIGFILVTLILMFFMGTTNALFVALSVPLSMFIAFMFMPAINFTLNMIVLFAFLLALGIVVDDAIVVIENTHRIFHEGKRSIIESAKMAAGEVFLPVLTGTLTTLAPFIPLAFWKGVIGKFMFFLPITLIITLLASLLVAYIINPVFAVDFMKHDAEPGEKKKLKFTKGNVVVSVIFVSVALMFYAGGTIGMGNFLIFIWLFYLLNKFVLSKGIAVFQQKIWPAIQNRYVKILTKALKRPYTMIFGTVVLFFLTLFIFGASKPKVVFFPQGDPNFIYVYMKLPVGADPLYTNAKLKQVEEKVYSVLGKNNPIVSSIITNVTRSVTDPQDQDQAEYTNRAKIAIAFKKFAERKGEKTAVYLQRLQALNWNISEAEIWVSKEQAGPPTAKPISIEVRGDNFTELRDNAKAVMDTLNAKIKRYGVQGVSELKMDMEFKKPEIIWDIDEERAANDNIKPGAIVNEMRTAIFGLEASKYRDGVDQYPIMLRYAKAQRNDLAVVTSHISTFRDMSFAGQLRNIPISNYIKIRNNETFGTIKRKDQKRIITISSDVLEGYNPNEVAARVKALVSNFKPVGNVTVDFGGQDKEQADTGKFLLGALGVSFGLIFLILVTQFNSFGKPLIILSEVFFSVIGVLLGVSITHMEMSIVMTGIGIVALAGIVVRNGILLLEFADAAREKGMGLYDSIVSAGRTRMTPVVLTATAAILGLIPLAVGLNIDFVELFTHGNPHLYFGGDSVVFWGPLSWTMIFGLGFATVLTLILVPAMYLVAERLKKKSIIVFEYFGVPKYKIFMYIPFFVLLLRLIARLRKHRFDWGDIDN